MWRKKMKPPGRRPQIEKSFLRATEEIVKVVGSSTEKIKLVEELRVQFVDLLMPHSRKALSVKGGMAEIG